MGWHNSKKTYESGPTPKYKVGDKVYLLGKWEIDNDLWMHREAKLCEVTWVSTKKSGLIWREFTYKITFLETGEKFKNIYESQLCEEKQRTEWIDPYEPIIFPINDDEDK